LSQRQAPFRNRARLGVERLEDRWAPAQFGVWNTNNTGDGSLRQAIIDANKNPDASSTITIAANGTVNLQSALDPLNKNITIIGPGEASFIVARNQSQSAFGIFSIKADKTCSIQQISIKWGDTSHGGGVYNNGTLTLTNVALFANGADSGGAIYNDSGATLVCNACAIDDNSVLNDGAGIDNEGYMTLALGTVVTENYGGTLGGGIYNNGTLTIRDNCQITSNAAQYGGGIYNSGPSLTMSGGSVSNNTATDSGGGIFENIGQASFGNVTMDNNSATNKGGGFYISSAGQLRYTGGEIKGNTAATGTAGYIQTGGAWIPDATVQITGTIIKGP
jgi:hypothetical protein